MTLALIQMDCPGASGYEGAFGKQGGCSRSRYVDPVAWLSAVSGLGYGAGRRVYVSGLTPSWLLPVCIDILSPIFLHCNNTFVDESSEENSPEIGSITCASRKPLYHPLDYRVGPETREA